MLTTDASSLLFPAVNEGFYTAHKCGRGDSIHLRIKHRYRGGTEPLDQFEHLRRGFQVSREHQPPHVRICH